MSKITAGMMDKYASIVSRRTTDAVNAIKDAIDNDTEAIDKKAEEVAAELGLTETISNAEKMMTEKKELQERIQEINEILNKTQHEVGTILLKKCRRYASHGYQFRQEMIDVALRQIKKEDGRINALTDKSMKLIDSIYLAQAPEDVAQMIKEFLNSL